MPNFRDDFPILKSQVNSRPLIYFDNAASTQKPQIVIDSLASYYSQSNSNIHRGAHHLANLATEAFENTRKKIAKLISAQDQEILFTSGTTHSINLLAHGWGRKFLTKSDTIVLTEMEHHANLVPWLALQREIGFGIRYINMNDNCELDLDTIDELLRANPKLISLAYISNAIGTIHPIKKIIEKVKSKDILIHLDCAQAIQHIPIDVQSLGVDFLSFSSHKMYGPMGVGVFWGKENLLMGMNPLFYGGEMIQDVSLYDFSLNKLPFRFEAGTPNVGDVVGLGAAVDYILSIGFDSIQKKEEHLQSYFREKINTLEDILLYTPIESSSMVSFNVKNIHPYDIGQMLDARGIAVRTGHHCCQTLMRKLKIEGTCRASLSFYNTEEEIDVFISELKKIIPLLS